MSSTSQGSVLAGRYRLERRIQTDPDGSLWRARDATLDRLVCIRVLRPGHPFAADVADAARRAALVDDPRLVRVLDVGSDDNVGFVVTENVHGETLADATERAPFSGPAIRRIVGEVAEGLAGAANRGLHHLRLTPRSVMIRSDGSITLLGTATEAAAAGLEPDHAASAGRVDAVGLIALVYSGLTGRWPLGDAGFPPAPHGDAGPIPPGELIRGVPNDLDTLCAVTLGPHNDGPRSPGEVVRQLAPWPSAAEVAATPAVPPRAAAQTTRPATITDRTAARPAPSPSSLFAPITPVSPDVRRDAPRGSGAPPAAAPARMGKPPGSTGAGTTGSTTPIATGPAASPSAALPAAAPNLPGRSFGGTAPGQRPAASTAPGPSAPPGPPAPTGGPETPGRPPRRSPQRRTPASGPRAGDSGELLMPWSGTWTTPESNAVPHDATGPFPILIPAEQPPREQSRLVLAGVAAALVVGLVLAVFSLRDFGRRDDPRSSAVAPLTSTSQGTPRPTDAAATTSAPTPAATTPAPARPSATASATPPVIEKIRSIDPQGDDEENNGDSPKAVDGMDSTAWTSDTYNSAAFGGLKKGLGLAIRLKEQAVISQVEVDVTGSGGKVELRGGPSADYQKSALLDSAAVDGGTVTLTTTSTKKYKYVILWFTKLPTDGGQHRAEVSEVRVT